MHFNIKLFEELETDTNIGWWNHNRAKVNEAIRLCNEWQINHRQDVYFAELVLAKVKSIKAWSEDKGNSELSEWQIDILDEIEKHVNSVIYKIQ